MTHFRPMTRNDKVIYYGFLLGASWTAVFLLSIVWNLHEAKTREWEHARVRAREAYQKDVAYRKWNAEKGGVYVLVTDKVKPNPFLTVSERDVTTALGHRLTLVNPAYMNSMVNKLQKELFGTSGHITSLKPFRPDNAPDPWETGALKSFQEGNKEFSSVENVDRKPAMWLMRPLNTEPECLRCHSQQGYKVGDIRGGISETVPMETLWGEGRSELTAMCVGHGILWARGLVGIGFGTRQLSRSWAEREQVQEHLQQAQAMLKAAMDQSPAGMAIADAPDVDLRYVNRAGWLICGGALTPSSRWAEGSASKDS